MDKEQAKEEIKKLIKKYERVKSEGKLRSYTEEQTKKDFIMPLFEALGWDVYNKKSEEVTAEEKVSKGRVDYAFRIDDIPKFFLEAKALKVDLDMPKWAEQATNYAWHKGVVWAILSDFEGMKVFNSEVKTPNPLQSMFFSLQYHQYINRFDQLWLLSRESFEKRLIDKEAEKWGKKLKKVPVDKQLLSDLTIFRSLLSKNILKNNANKNLSQEELDEAVQRIIDRLIFIRTCEDKELEAPVLRPLIREKQHKKLITKLNEIFRKFDDDYNSKLFTPHLCGELVIDDEVLERVIRGLHRTTDNSVHYDFGVIDADVLGNIYEQYLGHILKKTEKRAVLKSGAVHRKEQGIYYTPTYIVDYIVKNTIGELAKDKKFNMDKIRILDPACGSGSFLIKAFDFLNRYHSTNGGDEQIKLDISGQGATFSKKVEILKNNIFGVDLDAKAVEIAQLNLLLKAAEKKHRLPTLQENIKCGNSLIDDSKIAGDKAFKWKEEFSDIISKGGFDIVIGNPPYGAELSEKDKLFIKQKYREDRTGNTASLFIFKGLELLKEGGYISYIVPKQLTYISSWKAIRKQFLDLELIKIIDVSEAFPDVELEQIIFIARKTKSAQMSMIVGYSNNKKIEESITNKNYFSEQRFPLWITDKNHAIFDKVLKDTVPLSEIAKINWGGPVAKYLSKSKLPDSIMCLRGREIKRYSMIPEHYIKREDIVESYYVKGEKLLFQRIVSRCGPIIIANYRDARLNGTYCNENYYADKTVTIIWDSKIDLKFLLGMLNSRLISWFAHRYLYNRSQLTMEFMYDYARKFPIKKTYPTDIRNKVIKYVGKVLLLNKRLNELKDKTTDERTRIEKEIKKIDKEIDELVYKIYGITEKEKKIIEESLK